MFGFGRKDDAQPKSEVDREHPVEMSPVEEDTVNRCRCGTEVLNGTDTCNYCYNRVNRWMQRNRILRSDAYEE